MAETYTLDPVETTRITSWNFDSGVSPWASANTALTVAGATVSAEAVKVDTGAGAMKIVTGSSSLQGASALIAVSAYTTYQINARVLGNAGGEALELTVGALDAGIATTTFTGTLAYQTVTVTYTPTVSETLNLAVARIGTAVVTFYVDNVTVDVISTPAPVELEDAANGIQVRAAAFPPPDMDPLFAGSADTEGDPLVQNRFRNRTINLTVRCYSANGAAATRMRQRVRDVQRKVGKINREGGTLKRVLSDGTIIIFDLLTATVDVPDDFYFQHSNSADVTLVFTAKPLGRGAEVSLTDHAETTLPCIVGVDTGVTGDWPGLGRLIVDNDEATQDQFWMMWGIESRYYPGTTAGTSTAALFYQAPTRLLYGPSTLKALAGASGGTVAQGTATTSYQAVMSTSSSGTAYCSHVGDFNVWARVYDHSGSVTSTSGTAASLTWALQWSIGDFQKVTVNDGTISPVYNSFAHINLGQVHIPQVTQGAQRWEGQVLVKGVNTTTAYSVDDIYLQPIAEGSGQGYGITQPVAPTTFTARDEFSGTAGNLNTATAPVGGAWATSGAATDFAVEATGHTAQRATTADASLRFAVSGAAAQTNQVVQADVKFSSVAGGLVAGVTGRWVDASNYALGFVGVTGSTTFAGVILSSATTSANYYMYPVLSIATFYTLRLQIDASGRFAFYLVAQGSTIGTPLVKGQHALLATGGALASGKMGLADENLGATACTRNYDNFWAASLIPDAALYASRSLEVRSDQVIRQDSAGSVWGRPSVYTGDYFLVPPAASEGRSLRTIVKACRNDPATMADSGIDDISYQIKVMPRWLNVPEP